MRIQKLIDRVNSGPRCWVRVQALKNIPGGLEIFLSCHKGRHGRRLESWRIECHGVLEFAIADLDGGGLAIYSGTHPAARQYAAPHALLRCTNGVENQLEALGALYRAHTDAVDDWVPFDRYLKIDDLFHKPFDCRGPDFLLRTYAQSLRHLGCQVQYRPVKRIGTKARPKLLHFGESMVVANRFTFTEQV